jgi:hypothetical protein
MKTSHRLLVIGMVVLLMPACTLRGTTNQTTDTTQNTTVSTSGKSWITEDGLVREGAHVEAFTALNYDNLKSDIAAGGGEYLTSLGTLLGIPDGQRPAFFDAVQDLYASTSAANPGPGEFLLALDQRLASRSH